MQSEQKETYKILLVDDDRAIVDSTAIYLEAEGFEILKAYDGLEALEFLMEHEVQLVIMDVMMPNMDGIQATLKIRETKNIPIIILSAKTEDTDKILGLSIGADDYVPKPFNPLELVARAKSQIRRYTLLGNMVKKDEEIVIEGLAVNTRSKSVMVDGMPVHLTPIEYRILELLAKHPNRVFSNDEIYRHVWQEEIAVGDNTIAVHVRRIREKIEINPKEPKYLKVVWGIGYKLQKNH